MLLTVQHYRKKIKKENNYSKFHFFKILGKIIEMTEWFFHQKIGFLQQKPTYSIWDLKPKAFELVFEISYTNKWS